VRCDRFAAPGGSDGGPGSAARPFRTARRLAASLGAGRVGCLRRGVYLGALSFERGGRRGAPAVLQGKHATIRGTVSVPRRTHDLVVRGLRLRGGRRDIPNVQINGDRVTFADNDVTNAHTSSCFIIGGSFEDYGIAHDTRLLHNRIHGCGRRPPTGHDHGIYVEGAVGAVIRGNIIRDNADWGIQLYPYAIGSSITGNVIAANGGGVIFAGESARGEYSRGYASSHNRVAGNVITGARRLGNVDVYWGGPVGTGNVLEDNCLGGGGARSRRGLKARSNVGGDPGSARCRRALRGRGGRATY
jgi:parallel beta-helix repeat protein